MDSHEKLHEHIDKFMKSQNEMNAGFKGLIEGLTENQKKVAETLDKIAKMTGALSIKVKGTLSADRVFLISSFFPVRLEGKNRKQRY